MWVVRNGLRGGPGPGKRTVSKVCVGVLRTPGTAMRGVSGPHWVRQGVPRPVPQVRARAGGDAHDGLLLEIGESSTPAELLTVLRSNEREIMSSHNTTMYLSEAWDVILHNHHDFRGPSGQSGHPSGASGTPPPAANDPSARDEHGEQHVAPNGHRQEMRTLQGYMLEHTMPLVPQFSPASISMIARAMVATNTGAAADIVSISSDVQSRLVRFEPRELCMVLWSLSSHPGMDERQKQELFKSLASLVRQGMGMDNFTAKDLSILVWAVGHVAFRDRVLLHAAEEEAVKKHAEFSAEDLSRLFHGFASVNYNPHTLLPHVCMRYSAPDALEEFASRDLALLTVSLGKLVVEPPSGFCKALVARARDLVPVTAKASSRVNLGSGARSACGSDDAQASEDDKFDVHLNALVMWSFARLGLKKTSYVTRSLKYVFLGTNLERHAREDLIAVMWACCRLDVQLNSEQVARLSKTLTSRLGEERGGQRVPTAKIQLRDEDQLAPALCRGFRYLSMLHSRRKDAGRDPDSDKSINSNAHRIADEIFTGGLAENISPWEVASVVVALGAFSESSKGSLKSKPLPLRRIQRYLAVSIPAVDSSLLPKLTYTVAKLGLATNNAAVIEALSTAIVAKSGIIPAQGLVQVAYSYASMRSRTAGGAANDVARAVAPKLLDGVRHLSPKDRARAVFSMYQLAKQSGDRDKDLHLACKDMLLRHVTEADVASLDASTAFGLCLAFGSVAARHGTERSARGAIRQLRGWIVESFLTRVHGITSPKQLAGIQKVMTDTKPFCEGGTSSTADTNLDELLASRLSEFR